MNGEKMIRDGKAPEYAICSYKSSRNPASNKSVSGLARRLLKRDWLEGLPAADRLGTDGHCWRSVKAMVNEFGGELVPAWFVAKNKLDYNPTRNALGNLEAIPHAIWRMPDGQFRECIHFCMDRPWIIVPADDMQYADDGSIFFVDRLKQAESWQPLPGESMAIYPV